MTTHLSVRNEILEEVLDLSQYAEGGPCPYNVRWRGTFFCSHDTSDLVDQVARWELERREAGGSACPS